MLNLSLFFLFAAHVLGQIAPPGCKKLPKDADWPAETVWKAELPGVMARGPQIANATLPDYSYQARTVEQVQKAVKFVAENNIRLSILNSGHDFIGRSVCNRSSGNFES
jgi:heat shock protein HslJ